MNLSHNIDNHKYKGTVTKRASATLITEEDEQPELALSMLADIYSVHKALKFGQFQRTAYSLNDFISDVNCAEVSTLDNDGYSKMISDNKKMFNLSFYPLYY